jgi:hypothetical protein
MNATRDKDRVTLTFNALESRVLRQILGSIAANYKVPPAQMDPRMTAVWYSTRGCETARMSAEDTRDWLEQLHGFKSANLGLIADWIKQLAQCQKGQYELCVNLEQASRLVTVLNDHRLLAAAQNNIGQEAMDMPSQQALQKLAPAQQVALFEIHLLAWIVEELLRLIAPEAANWMT